MKNKLSKLIDVKSIVTILLTLFVCYLAIKGKINVEQIYLMIIAFYFGTQANKVEKTIETNSKTKENPENITKN